MPQIKSNTTISLRTQSVVCVCMRPRAHMYAGATEAKGAGQIWLRQTAMLLATPLLFYLLLKSTLCPAGDSCSSILKICNSASHMSFCRRRRVPGPSAWVSPGASATINKDLHEILGSSLAPRRRYLFLLLCLTLGRVWFVTRGCAVQAQL